MDWFINRWSAATSFKVLTVSIKNLTFSLVDCNDERINNGCSNLLFGRPQRIGFILIILTLPVMRIKFSISSQTDHEPLINWYPRQWLDFDFIEHSKRRTMMQSPGIWRIVKSNCSNVNTLDSRPGCFRGAQYNQRSSIKCINSIPLCRNFSRSCH